MYNHSKKLYIFSIASAVIWLIALITAMFLASELQLIILLPIVIALGYYSFYFRHHKVFQAIPLGIVWILIILFLAMFYDSVSHQRHIIQFDYDSFTDRKMRDLVYATDLIVIGGFLFLVTSVLQYIRSIVNKDIRIFKVIVIITAIISLLASAASVFILFTTEHELDLDMMTFVAYITLPVLSLWFMIMQQAYNKVSRQIILVPKVQVKKVNQLEALNQIEVLHRLKLSGAISEAEFNEKKSKALEAL